MPAQNIHCTKTCCLENKRDVRTSQRYKLNYSHRLQALVLHSKLERVEQWSVVERWAFYAGEQVAQDTTEQGQVVRQELWNVHILCFEPRKRSDRGLGGASVCAGRRVDCNEDIKQLRVANDVFSPSLQITPACEHLATKLRG